MANPLQSIFKRVEQNQTLLADTLTFLKLLDASVKIFEKASPTSLESGLEAISLDTLNPKPNGSIAIEPEDSSVEFSTYAEASKCAASVVRLLKANKNFRVYKTEVRSVQSVNFSYATSYGSTLYFAVGLSSASAGKFVVSLAAHLMPTQ